MPVMQRQITELRTSDLPTLTSSPGIHHKGGRQSKTYQRTDQYTIGSFCRFFSCRFSFAGCEIPTSPGFLIFRNCLKYQFK